MSVLFSYETDADLGVGDYEELIKDVISAVLESEDCPYEAEVNVTIGDDETIRTINRDFRDIDKETDVLSFPAVEFGAPGDFEGMAAEFEENSFMYFNPDTGELMLGDMILSADRVRKQAEEYGHSRKRELAFLVAHSMFHLLGYDHMEPEEAQVMEKRQEEVLEQMGITRQ